MTEAEWLACAEPGPMLERITVPGHRKSRLFACTCCRRIASLITLKAMQTIEVAERFADGNATGDDLYEAHPKKAPSKTRADFSQTYAAAEAVCCAVAEKLDAIRVMQAQSWAAAASTDRHAEGAAQANLLRDIFGNPFRPMTLDPQWRESTVVALAQQMYESRDFSAMPILADALQDAGCDNDDILTHCRDANGVHVRGCWVVDLVLGKE